MLNRINQATARNRALREAASTEKVTPKKLANLVPAQMFGVRYGDASGNPVTTVVFKIGNAWYMDMENGQAWTGDLSPCAPWLVEQLESGLKAQQETVVAPEKDSVEILGGDE